MTSNHHTEDVILEINSISKDFSGVYALEDVSMKLYKGKVNAIIGENGAGKSTLMKIISGVYTASEGELLMNGKYIQFKNPKEAGSYGVNIIHQELNLVPHMTISENIFLGNELRNSWGFLDYPGMQKRAKELLLQLELQVSPNIPVNKLRVGQQQLVEIAKALLLDSRLLIMDEPTSALSDHEVELLFKIIKRLKSQGVAIVYISHKLDELFNIADNYNVFRDGKFIGSGEMKDISADELIGMMVGRELKKVVKDTSKKDKAELLRVEDLSLRNPANKADFLLKDINFTLGRGEILGISGLMGAGRTEVLEALFGLFPTYVSGKIYIEANEIRIKNPGDAISAGMALVPEDRKLQGLVLNMTVAKNTSLASMKAVSKYGFVSKVKEKQLSEYFTQKLNTRYSKASIEVEKLSGGNQQKVVLSKWLATKPRILLLDEPTRGIDIGAKSEIYSLMNDLAAEGMGIIFVSSELSEVLSLADHILVLSESRQSASMSREEASEEKIMKAALLGKKKTKVL